MHCGVVILVRAHTQFHCDVSVAPSDLICSVSLIVSSHIDQGQQHQTAAQRSIKRYVQETSSVCSEQCCIHVALNRLSWLHLPTTPPWPQLPFGSFVLTNTRAHGKQSSNTKQRDVLVVEREHAHADALAIRASESLACLSECFVCFGASNSDCVTVPVWVRSNQFGNGLL